MEDVLRSKQLTDEIRGMFEKNDWDEQYVVPESLVRAIRNTEELWSLPDEKLSQLLNAIRRYLGDTPEETALLFLEDEGYTDLEDMKDPMRVLYNHIEQAGWKRFCISQRRDGTMTLFVIPNN